MASILIPVQGSEEVVEVNVDELPEDAGDVIDILQAEVAPLDLWLRFAIEYYKQGRTEHFKQLLDPLVDLQHQPPSQPGFENALYENFGSGQDVKNNFIAILNALAAFHMLQAARERDRTKRSRGFVEAKKYYNNAEKLDPLDGSTVVGDAVLSLVEGKLDLALQKLTASVDFNKNNVPALLAKACAKFQAGKHAEALKLYLAVFKANPNPPAAVRLGLAFCSAKLGHTAPARKALERTLQLQEDNVEALAGLAVLELNDERVSGALALFKRAYEIEPTNANLLNQLANHYFFKSQYDKAKTLAQRAFRNSASSAIRAESCHHMGRAFHAQRDFASALQWYTQATKENADFLPPHFGLGQMHIQNNKLDQAIVCFEKVLQKHPDDVDSLKTIGTLYALTERRALAKDKLTRVTELAPHDVSAWLELAKLHERFSLASALKAYEKAAGILKRAQRRVPLELWNNLGALRHRLGKIDSAEQAYMHALKAGKDSPVDEQNVTTSFNLARLWETKGEMDRAEKRYKEILKQHPNYVDCFLRLAAISKARGNLPLAVTWVKRGLDVEPLNPDAWCTLGGLQMAQRNWHAADASFKQVLIKCGDSCKRDAYATLSLANIQIALAATSKEAGPKLDKAAEMFKTVLSHEPNNLYAANGLGVVCVFKGRFSEAREIFNQVRESSSDCEPAMLNLAQLHALLKEPSAAATLYHKALRRSGPAAQAELLGLEARAQFEGGRTPEARRALLKALRLRPSDPLLWFNLCLVLIRSAKPAKGTKGPREVEAVLAAQEDAEQALRLCGGISRAPEAELKRAEGLGLRKERIESLRGKIVSLQQELAAERVQSEEVREQQAKEQREAEEQLAAAEAERAVARLAEEEARSAARAEEEEVIRRRKAALEAKLSQWKEEEAREKESGEAAERRKKRRRGLDDEPAASSD